MDRRDFFKAAGGSVVVATLLDFAPKPDPESAPVSTPTEIRPSDCEQLVVTATLDDGTTFTWVIVNPEKGIIPGPIMPRAGTIISLDFYSVPHEYLGRVELSHRAFNVGDTISLDLR